VLRRLPRTHARAQPPRRIPNIRDYAAAWLTIAFNAAIGGGALLGGLIIDGLGMQALPWIASSIVAVGFFVALFASRERMRVLR
jgi:predicted MFS family arabinose efflux permease